MEDPNEIIATSRPLLEEFLADIGLHSPGERIADAHLLERFSDWLDLQEVTEEDFWFYAALIAAFISEYLIEQGSATRHVEGQRIRLRMPVDVARGVYREFEPHMTSVGLVQRRGSLKDFLLSLST